MNWYFRNNDLFEKGLPKEAPTVEQIEEGINTTGKQTQNTMITLFILLGVFIAVASSAYHGFTLSNEMPDDFILKSPAILASCLITGFASMLAFMLVFMIIIVPFESPGAHCFIEGKTLGHIDPKDKEFYASMLKKKSLHPQIRDYAKSLCEQGRPSPTMAEFKFIQIIRNETMVSDELYEKFQAMAEKESQQ